MASLAGKTLVITGASRGIGRAIALRAARDGANIVIAARTDAQHVSLDGTIHETASEVEACGGQALPVKMDLRKDDDVAAAVDAAVARFGAVDILVHNAGALYRGSTEHTEMKRFDLMLGINLRGPYLLTKLCIPHLRRAANPHVLSIAPLPIVAPPERFALGAAFEISKLNLSLLSMAFAAEFAEDGIAFNTLWPRLSIWTEGNRAQHGEENKYRARRPAIMADAAWHILTQDSRRFSGRATLDDDVLRDAGVTDFAPYYYPGSDPADMFAALQVSHGLRTIY